MENLEGNEKSIEDVVDRPELNMPQCIVGGVTDDSVGKESNPREDPRQHEDSKDTVGDEVGRLEVSTDLRCLQRDVSKVVNH